MIPPEKLDRIKKELEHYTDVALIKVLYDRIVESTTKEVLTEDANVTVSNVRKTYPITCSNCGTATTVPFKPAENQKTPLLCIDCYDKKKRGVLN